MAVLGLLLTLLVGVGPARAAGTLSGTVTGDGTGLTGVLIELQPLGGGAAVETATTGGTGSYTLTAAAGTYDIVATPPAGSLFSSATVSGVTLADETTETVDIQLVLVDDGGDPVPDVTGTVTVGGSPFAGAIVEMQESAGGAGVLTTTAGDGSFALTPDSTRGFLSVLAEAGCGDASLPEHLSLRSVHDTDVTTTYPVDLVVAPLTVLVLDPDGVEVPGAVVELAGSGRPAVPPAPLGGDVAARTACGRTTGADGRVTQATAVGIPTTVTVSATGYASLSLDVTVEGLAGQEITASLQPPPVPVTGVVLGVDGTPREGVTVEVFVTPEQPAAQVVSGADGSFRLVLVPGARTLRLSADGLGTAAEGGPAAPFEATVGIDVPAAGVDLGTWRVPLAAVDLDVVLEGTGELLRSRINPSLEEAPVTVFGAPGEISNAGRFQTILTESTTEPASAPLYLVPGEVHTLAFLNDSVPDGYARPDPNWTITGPAAYSRTSATRELPLSGGDGLLVGRVVQNGVGVPGVVVADVRGEFVRTDADGRFQLPIATGERDIAVNVGSEANAPGFASARLNNLEVLPGTTDLGDLALPYVSWDVRVAVPAGEEPIDVDLETAITSAFIDAGWGMMSFTGGYPVTGGIDEDVRVTADGRANRLWMVPSSRSFRLDVTPVGSTEYAPATSFPTVAGPSTLLVQLQRLADPDPVDLPPTISGLTPRSIGESAPNVRLSVAATDPEEQAVTVSWDVLGISPAPTGLSVDLGPLDGPQDFDAVATACDPAGNCASFTIAVEIRDEPPTLTALLAPSAEVGEDVVLTASATDPRDDVTVDVDWGDGSAVEPVVEGSAVHAWSASGTYLVTVRAVTDDAIVSEVFSIVVAPGAGDSGGDDPGDVLSTPSIAYTPTTVDAEVGTAITPLSPTNSGGATDAWAIAPALPAGLSIDAGTGVISGTPTAASATADYTVTASNTAGSDTFVVTLTVAAGPRAATTVELTASATTVLVGDPVELIATVDGSDPTGTVEFFDGSVSLGSATLSSPAVLTVSSLAVGPHTITAVYEGDDANESSSITSPLKLTVVPAPSAEVDTTTQTAGDTLPVTGEAFQPGTDVTIALGDDATVLGSTTVADDGTFSIDVALPADVDGDQPLTISGTDQTGDSVSIVLNLTMEATLPAAGYPSEMLTLLAIFLLGAGARILSRSKRRELLLRS